MPDMSLLIRILWAVFFLTTRGARVFYVSLSKAMWERELANASSSSQHGSPAEHFSCVPKLSAHTSKSTDLQSHASEEHEGPTEVHETLRLCMIS